MNANLPLERTYEKTLIKFNVYINFNINFFKVNPSEHVFFVLLEAEITKNIEKTGYFTVTPVIYNLFSIFVAKTSATNYLYKNFKI